MKIAIISDIHDNLVNLEKCLSWCKADCVEQLICCGDVTNAETVQFISENFPHQIHLVRGNADIFGDKEIKRLANINNYGRIALVELAGKKIGVCHEPFLIGKVLELGVCDIVFYGHTHKPWESKEAGVRAINPGTLGGVFQKATFAVWDMGKEELELKILELL